MYMIYRDLIICVFVLSVKLWVRAKTTTGQGFFNIIDTDCRVTTTSIEDCIENPFSPSRSRISGACLQSFSDKILLLFSSAGEMRE